MGQNAWQAPLKQGFFALAFFLMGGSLLAQQHCEREYRFHGFSLYGDTCWIEIIEHGSCERAAFMQLSMGANGTTAMKLSTETHIEWIERSQEPHFFSYAVAIEPKGDKFAYPLADLSVKNPPYNASLYNLYHEELRTCGEAWNNAMGQEKGIVLPKIDSPRTPALLYAAPEGLYFNYEITKAYYFPDVRILVLFTHNPLRCTHGAHTDGYLVFKLK